MGKYRSENIDTLFKAILTLQNIDECYHFFQDVATIPEIKSLAQRLQVAMMILEDETYSSISQKSGASTATISRVKNCLYYGEDGYQLAIARLKESKEREGGNE